MRKIFASFNFVLLILQGHSQGIDSVLERYAADFQPEKTWLHFDKSSYYPGETIWFKAYLMETLFPATESKTLYIDWIGENGSLLSHSVAPLVDGTTNGQLEIPSGYTGQFIHVQAYTKWMLNFDTAFLYSRDIRILPGNPTAARPVRPAVIATLELFPEGGDMIAGVSNRIAFKASDQWGRPLQIKGVVQDNKGATIDSLRILHDGMGSFYLNPRQDQNYVVKWTDQKGEVHKTALPTAKTSGISMQVTNRDNRCTVNLYGTDQLSETQKTVHLVGTINQRMAFKTEVPITQGGVRRIIPTGNLPSGIMTITVFDQSWNAMAERIVFINNHDFSFEPSMEVKHWGLGKRKKNEIQITLPDSLQAASLSISVTDASIEKDTTNNVISHFMLTSDIKGRVNNPAYYFSGNSDSVARHLDLVMLTHGWRRFKWEDVTSGKLPRITYPRDTGYLSLSGKVFGVAKGQLSGKESIVLLVKADSTSKMFIMPIQTDGSFNDPDIVFFDTVKVYYSLKSKFLRQAEARFMTERLPAPNYSAFIKNFLPPHPLSDTIGTYRHSLLAAQAARIRDMNKGKMMENITVTARQKTTIQAMEERYPSGMFKGGDGYQFDLANDPASAAYMNVLNYLQGKVAGLQISTTEGTASLSWRGGSPQLYLDEAPVDADLISTVPVTDIAYVKVFRPPFMGGFNGGNGAIAVYTRRGNDSQNRPGTGLSSNTIAGYTPIRQFYSPNYDRFDPRNEQPDTRTTLYWNPLVTTIKSKPVVISFFNNDSTKAFRVVIEGMSKEGLITHYEQIME